MKGYKAFKSNLTCRNMQYEIGKEYTFDGEPIPCQQGFHFCKTLKDCYTYYPMLDTTRICEVKAIGDIKTDDGIKYCTNKIKIIREIKNPKEKTNSTKSSTGYCNSGDNNSGNWNSGFGNSGNDNSGCYNSGNCNSGNCNSGNRNSGDNNSGNWNSGDNNSGNWNSGHRNTGDWNSGNRNSGVFNTNKQPKIRMFDAESEWTMDDWYYSSACRVMFSCPHSHNLFISVNAMTEEEKEQHPEYKTTGGYIKTIEVTAEDKQKWWDELTMEEKQSIFDLPNFNKKKFEECVGIRVTEDENNK